MSQIVVGYDGSACGEAALEAALALAPPLGDEITVVFGYAPPGIWAMERSESRPLRARLSTGTPSTGKVVMDATMPGRCAAPPAPAMITLIPRASASLA